MMSAITISNVSFSYSGNSVLTNINADIPYGKIYSLLGPSGAGKTTLLRLVLGRIKPSSGMISVLGNEPGENNRAIGYMPQDTALCMSFTVEQTLQYFSNIYKLSDKKFQERKKTLNAILGLPDKNMKISELSGGQQKMVSLSLAFLHDPKLLILDEPTVGSDPILGNCIWKYLHHCCLQNVSIVIVTHYIEEAGFGHAVGIMRNGRILEEGTPSSLVNKYNQNTLEDVFLFLCKVANNFVDSKKDKVKKESKLFQSTPSKLTQPTATNDQIQVVETSIIRNIFLFTWILLVLTRKNINRFLHLNISLLIFLIPAFQAWILCCLYNRDSVPVHTAVFNEDTEPFYSNDLLKSIEKVDVYYVNPIKYDTLDSAVQAVKDGKVVGVIWFGQNFSESLDTRVLEPETIDNQTLISSTVKVFLDSTPFLSANGLIDSLRQSVYHLLGNVYAKHNLARLEAPIDLREVVYAKDSKLSDLLLPGYLISFIYLSQVTLSSQLLIQEKKDGLFERSLVAGVGHHLVFLSHFLSSCILSIVQIGLMLFVSLFIFQITNYGSYELIFILIFAQAINAVSTGLLVSSIFDEGFVAVLASIFITFSQLFSSGSIFPMEFVTPSLRSYLYFCPIALPSESLRNVMLRGWKWFHPLVYHGFLTNTTSAILLSLFSVFIFKRYG